MVNIGIIGTAGRKEDQARMTKDLYVEMKKATLNLIIQIEPDLNNVTLVSGGAAWSDHIAVSLYLENLTQLKLVLYLPDEWDNIGMKYVDSGEINPQKNPGGTSNYYHRLFSEKIGINTLTEIQKVKDMGANLVTKKGFSHRNNLISKNIQYLLAFTWGNNDIPIDGGTLITWKHCPNTVNKLHIPLSRLDKFFIYDYKWNSYLKK